MGRHRRPTDTSWSGAMSGMPICWAACCPEWTRYHQAAMVGHGVDPADAPPAYAGPNDLGTAVLLAAMYTAGVRHLVLAGSMVVYGEDRYDCPEHG
jgi:nucleoside-diphosphate-sugar epimerase